MGTNVHVIQVNGIPAPKGSMRAFKTKGGKAIVAPGGSKANEKKLKAWHAAIIESGIGSVFFNGGNAASVGIVFRLPDLEGFKRSDESLKESAPFLSVSYPDVDKLVRSTLDALTAAGVWNDDSQVAFLTAAKVYTGDQPSGACIILAPGHIGGQLDVSRIVGGELARITGERARRMMKKLKHSVTAAKAAKEDADAAP